MANTTRAAIRDNMVTLLETLAPTTLSSELFRISRGEQDFTAWCEANPDAAFRRFTLRYIGTLPSPTISDEQTEMHEDDRIELRVAYPRLYGKYGSDNEYDLYDLVDEDLGLIDGLSGIGMYNAGDYVSGQHSSIRQEVEIEDDPGSPIVFLRVEYRVDYNRAVSD